MAVTADLEKTIHLFLKLASQKVSIVEAYVFGSSATGERRKWSDIDVALVSSDFSGDPLVDSKILFPVILQVDRSIEVHPFHPKDFVEGNPFVREILRTGVRVL